MPEESRKQHLREDTEPSRKKPLVLIVDDYLQNIQVLAQNLEMAGYDIAIGRNGEEALSLAEKVNPDLILLDVMMPDMTGFEVCEVLRKGKETADTPVIFLTAKVEMEDVLQGYQSGGSDYIYKPFNSYELLARVRMHLELSYSRRALGEVRSIVEGYESMAATSTANECLARIKGEVEQCDFSKTF